MDAQGIFYCLRARCGTYRSLLPVCISWTRLTRSFYGHSFLSCWSLRRGCLFLGVMLTLPWILLLEVSRGSSHLPYSRLKHLKADLHLLHLIDPWRLLHPHDRHYFLLPGSSDLEKAFDRVNWAFMLATLKHIIRCGQTLTSQATRRHQDSTKWPHLWTI